MADGADHVPSLLRATTRPVPTLYVSIRPILNTVRIARPLAPLRTASGIDFSGANSPICKQMVKEHHVKNITIQ